MKSIKYFSILVIAITLFSCEAIKNGSNTTGGLFSLNGQWELISNSPENTLIGSKLYVAPVISEGRFTVLLNNTQCFRENDVKWKNITPEGNGGFSLNNLLSNCNAGALNYQPATIYVLNNNEIRLNGKNVAGTGNVQVWRRIK